MAFFRTLAAAELVPTVAGEGVTLRTPQMADYQAWADLRSASRSFLRPWEPIWPADDLTRLAYRRRLKRYVREIEQDQAYPFFVFDAEGQLVGGVTLSQVRRGVAQTCSVGYWMGERHAGRGLMTKAVRALAPFVFTQLKLRRIEAACLPFNAASIRLLEKTGFQKEGYAREYLCIDGVWQDHLLYALLRSDAVG
ncbi:ribosomal-protein-alanine N-acetyltransferase [Methylopila capsulata]|uniref:Ribosomal-protein-alanine N-acetyltransferase n=1 Tax=Methylopila capsulata TaxID=61654 RepID=A0A9W6MT61_9HYPH|nr:GNAT family protein [Methylopila capsulata]MBM7852713.1 ribosomal-protein-alanine N-acetyltransferase [Methylopila capsulata]GLK56922.1 ribosomal-protein-alanine N-acetyltransferase [Methylopila capsulata]